MSEENNKLMVQPKSIVAEIVLDGDTIERRLNDLRAFVDEYLVEGINNDYAIIPGCQKKSLLKPGALKLKDVYGLEIKMTEVKDNRIEDFDKGYFDYTYKCEVHSKKTGFREGDYEASCNTREKKFVKQCPYTIKSTVRQVSQKRAMVGAVIMATSSSGIFTQDIEDMPDIVKPTTTDYSDNKPNDDKPAVKYPSLAQKNTMKKYFKEKLKLSEPEARALFWYLIINKGYDSKSAWRNISTIMKGNQKEQDDLYYNYVSIKNELDGTGFFEEINIVEFNKKIAEFKQENNIK